MPDTKIRALIPIIFLNSDVFTKVVRVSPRPEQDRFAGPGRINALEPVNRSPDVLNRLCAEIGAQVVLTDDDGRRDVQGSLLGIGFRPRYHPDGKTATSAERAGDIRAWLRGHPDVLPIVIDRPGLPDVPGAIMVSVRDDAEITDGAVGSIEDAVKRHLGTAA